MEKLIHNQIYEYLQETNLLPESQHGFRPLHSTVSALLKITNLWNMNMDIGRNKKILDLKKGFDTVDRKILLNKLDLYGIKGIAHTWIRSYLSQRTQYCQVNCRMSEPLTILTGIPQSSILGSL